jgi:integrase
VRRVSQGTVYKRAGTWTIGWSADGRRYREAVGGSKKLAEMILRKRLTEAIEGRYFNARKVCRVSFTDFAGAYLERATALLKSPKTERVRVNFWVKEFGGRLLSDITRAELEAWQRGRLQRNKPSTVNRYLCRLRHMLNKAVEWELLDESPMKGLKFLRENNARLRYLSLEECGRLLKASIAPHLRAMVTVALHTGMRSGEIRNLLWRDLDFDSGFLVVRDSKNSEPRHVPLDSTLTELFCNYPRTPGSDFVFPNADGGRLGWIQKGFRNARERAGLSDLHFHDLRHTMASQWMMHGGDLYALKEILGHKSIAMTQRYAHLSPAYKQAMVRQIERIWEKPAAEPRLGATRHSLGHRPVTRGAARANPVCAKPLRTLASKA